MIALHPVLPSMRIRASHYSLQRRSIVTPARTLVWKSKHRQDRNQILNCRLADRLNSSWITSPRIIPACLQLHHLQPNSTLNIRGLRNLREVIAEVCLSIAKVVACVQIMMGVYKKNTPRDISIPWGKRGAWCSQEVPPWMRFYIHQPPSFLRS